MITASIGSRGILLYGALVVASALLAMVAVGELTAANAEYAGAQGDLAECARMVGDIERLNRQPRVASLDVESPQQTIERVAEAQRLAALPADSLLSVSPAAPIRREATDFQQRNTELVLQNVELEKLANFVSVLEDNDDGLFLRDVALTPSISTAADASKSSEQWSARLTLTQLIYSPKSR